MNKMSLNDWEGFKADIGTVIIIVLILFVLVIIWNRIESDPTLIDEPCAPGMPIIVDGEKVGCTNDKPNPPPGYYPRNK